MGEEEREEEGAAQIGWTNVLIEQRGESPRVVRTVRTKRVVLFTFFFCLAGGGVRSQQSDCDEFYCFPLRGSVWKRGRREGRGKGPR